jgi:hypothetical protein
MHWLWIAWAASGAALFAALETYALRHRGDDDLTLTEEIARHIPRWLFFAGLGALEGWIASHFDVEFDERSRARRVKKD